MQSYQQQYMAAYNPYYMYMLSYPNGYAPQMPAMYPMDMTHVNQNQSTNQDFSSPSVNQGVSNQNPTNETSVRQRTVGSQQVTPESVNSQPVYRGPSPNANAGMVSLVVIWFVVVSALAFVLRRIFMD